MPGIANCTVPRLRAKPGSLLSLLPVQNVKDQPVGESRRKQSHTHLCACTLVHLHKYTLVHVSAHPHTHTQTHVHMYTLSRTKSMHIAPRRNRQMHPHSERNTSRPGSPSYHIMRAPARPSDEASAEMIQGSPLGPHLIS